jgi:hypothetical protein
MVRGQALDTGPSDDWQSVNATDLLVTLPEDPVVHGAQGRMRVLVTGITDIADDDLFYPDNQ